MGVLDERKALDSLSGAYRRLVTGGRRPPPAEPPPEGEAPALTSPQPPQAPSGPRQRPPA
ncbi:MAG: hypothetical protein V3S20_04375 [Dehalococcoidia bacterium]